MLSVASFNIISPSLSLSLYCRVIPLARTELTHHLKTQPTLLHRLALLVYAHICCLFDLACFFLSSFSSLIKNMYTCTCISTIIASFHVLHLPLSLPSLSPLSLPSLSPPISPPSLPLSRSPSLQPYPAQAPPTYQPTPQPQVVSSRLMNMYIHGSSAGRAFCVECRVLWF